ncbi:hypothetical protein CRUP_021772 [Coryphaenoides rupestris]|nr:hypothetical protein CRUP_021772 [Coryphaenoides rupestris]
MRSTMRQWLRLALVLLLAWALFFLPLLSYFLDARVDEPLASEGSSLSLQPDTRCLASIQGSQQQQQEGGGAGSRPDPTATRAAADPPSTATVPASSSPAMGRASLEAGGQRDPSRGGAYATAYTSQEEEGEEVEGEDPKADGVVDYLDPQSLAAWSSFGTENVGSHSYPATTGEQRSRERTPHTTAERRGGEEEEEEEVGGGGEGEGEEGDEQKRRNRPGGDSADPREEYYFLKFGSVVQRLWRGRVSAGMLSPRLQRALEGLSECQQAPRGLQGAPAARTEPPGAAVRAEGAGRQAPDAGRVRGALLLTGLGSAGAAPPPGGALRGPTGSGLQDLCRGHLRRGPSCTRGLGEEIDAHDAVLRFNTAPTEGFEKDWYTSPDYNLFGPYVERRQLQPQQPFYVLHPSYVHVYEYIPSLRQTDLCHYHERYYDSACTMGAYHPLLFEKSLVQRLNTGTASDLWRKGRLTLPGLTTIDDCDAAV